MSEALLLITPMVLVLLSIALMPLLVPNFWHKAENIIFIGVVLFSVIADLVYIPTAKNILLNAIFHDYLPFIVMLFTLYVLSHGIHIKVNATPTTLANVVFLAIGSIISSFIGTTGAAMLLIRPFIAFNEVRTRKAHLLIFFIIMIANIGGLLTPLGDPPLLLGYLHGVDFTWLTTHMLKYWGGYIAICLTLLSIIDKLVLKYEHLETHTNSNEVKISVEGTTNIILLCFTAIILFINVDWDVKEYAVPTIYVKDAILLVLTATSLWIQRKMHQHIEFAPFVEVVRTFFVIFIVLAPVLYLMENNINVIHKFLYSLSNEGKSLPLAYFTLCSMASAFLDNAPSYLLFFHMTGHEAAALMTQHSDILVAISVSSVVMGSMTYIGNAPNMMVRNIAQRRSVAMPSFVAYLGYACLIVLPASYILIRVFNFR